ncbi:hypothetical protein RI367_005221 [Sorochytrium milnesiophthora]
MRVVFVVALLSLASVILALPAPADDAAKDIVDTEDGASGFQGLIKNLLGPARGPQPSSKDKDPQPSSKDDEDDSSAGIKSIQNTFNDHLDRREMRKQQFAQNKNTNQPPAYNDLPNLYQNQPGPLFDHVEKPRMLHEDKDPVHQADRTNAGHHGDDHHGKEPHQGDHTIKPTSEAGANHKNDQSQAAVTGTHHETAGQKPASDNHNLSNHKGTSDHGQQKPRNAQQKPRVQQKQPKIQPARKQSESQVNKELRSQIKHETLGDVVLKTGAAGDSARLRHEYAVTRALAGVKGIHVPLAEVADATVGSYALAFPADHPLPGAQTTLADILRTQSCISVDQALCLLRGTACLLEQVHGRGIVFCNVSPDSLWVSLPAAQAQHWSDIEVSLTDFGYARKSSSDVAAAVTEHVCGDLRFMSPECTGRTNRPIDARSDIYSLGMLMHAALTGDMPPKDLPILQRVHACLASTPEPLTHASDNMSPTQGKALALQRVLEGMTTKLPEQRFSSCTKVVRCLDELAAFQGNWQDFQPRLSTCHDDLLQTFLADSKLYGRDEEVKQLLLAQKLAHGSGKSQVIVVKGSSGVGKTSLVQELMLPTCSAGGLFCMGKFDQYQTSVPHQALVQAFSQMIALLLTDSLQTVTAVAKDLNDQLGDNLELALNTLPNLRHLLSAGGVQNSATAPPVTDEAGEVMASAMQYPERISQRLQQSLSTMLSIVTGHGRPLTLFLDDMQWADHSSLLLVAALIRNGLPERVLLVLTYRSDDPATVHERFQKFEATLQSLPKEVLSCVQLDCLSIDTTQLMLKDMLGDVQPTSLLSLASFIHRHTLGNALYIRKVLCMLVDCGALRLVESVVGRSAVTWDESRAQGVTPSDGAADLLAHQLQQLPPLARSILGVGALLDKDFALHAVANILSIPTPIAAQALQQAVSLGFLSRQGGDASEIVDHHTVNWNDDLLSTHTGTTAMKALDGTELVAEGLRYRLIGVILATTAQTAPEARTVHYQWRHDKLRQAAAQLLNDSDCQQVHNLIGSWQLNQLLTHGNTGLVFDVVNHFCATSKTLARQQDHISLAKLCIIACAESRARSAFNTALRYGQLAVHHAKGASWTDADNTLFLAWHSLITVEHDNALYDDMSEHVAYVLRQPLPVHARGSIIQLRIMQHISQGQPSEAIALATVGLNELGYPLPGSAEDANQMIAQLPRDAAVIVPRDALLKPLDAAAVVAAAIARDLIVTCWIYEPRRAVSLIALGANIAVKNGLRPADAGLYATLAVHLRSLPGQDAAAWSYIRLAHGLASRYGSYLDGGCVNGALASFFQPWVSPIHEAVTLIDASILSYKTALNMDTVLLSTSCSFELLAGTSAIDLRAQMEQYVEHPDHSSDTPGTLIFRIHLDLAQRLVQPSPPTTQPYPDPSIEQAAASPNGSTYPLLHCLKAQLLLLLLTGDISQGLACIDAFTLRLDSRYVILISFACYQLCAGLVLARHLMVTENQSDERAQQQLRECVALHEDWAGHCASTFGSPFNLLRGCQLANHGNVVEGLEYIDRAVELAKQQGLLHLEAMAYETLGHIYQTILRSKTTAMMCMRAAQQAYQRWGVTWKAQMLDEQYGSSQPLPNECAMADVVDLGTVNGWLAALASEATQDSLVIKFMDLAMMHTGSRDGRLFWTQREPDDDGLNSTSAINLQCISRSSGSTHISTVMRPQQVLSDAVALLVNYVQRTRETLTESSPRIKTLSKPGALSKGSMLLLPIILRDRCVGVLYLSNEFTPPAVGDMAQKRLGMMQSLSAQLALTLEDMRLIDKMRASKAALQAETVTLQERVHVRTKELLEANAMQDKALKACQMAEQEALSASESSRSFLHRMSHELRTPLNAIIGVLDLLIEEPSLSKEALALLLTGQTASHSLERIVNDTLDLGKIQAGKMSLSIGPFSLRNEVEFAMDSVAQAAANKHLTLVTHYPGTLPQSLNGDGVRIGQVLRNLLSNAVKFTDQGHVLLDVTASESKKYAGRYRFTAHCTDTGQGIAEEDMQLLFQCFSQVDSAQTRQHNGTGLGLNISRGFAKLMRGDVTCTSQVGQGSTFTFTFKCDAEPATALSIALPEGVHIVVCHALPVVRDMVSGYLSGLATAPDITCIDTGDLDALLATAALPVQKRVLIGDNDTLQRVPDTLPKVVLGGNAVTPTERLTRVGIPLRQDELLRAIQHVCSEAPPVLTTSTGRQLRPTFPGLKKALLVEDNDVNRRVATSLLSKFDIVPDIATDGVEAVVACRQTDYNLILMDVSMPRMDGTDATVVIRRRLKAEHRPQPIIIAVSANAFKEDHEKCIACGMTDTLPKPLRLNALQAMICTKFTPLIQEQIPLQNEAQVPEQASPAPGA